MYFSCCAGASDDFKHATSIADQMVKKLGMSEKIGFRTFQEPKDFMANYNVGPNTSELVRYLRL